MDLDPSSDAEAPSLFGPSGHNTETEDPNHDRHDDSDGSSDGDSGWGTEAFPGPARIAARLRMLPEVNSPLPAARLKKVEKGDSESRDEEDEEPQGDAAQDAEPGAPMRDPTYESPLPAGWTPPRTPEGWCPETEAELSRELAAFLGRRSRGARVSTGPTTASHVGARS